jgi:hypothetical protein
MTKLKVTLYDSLNERFSRDFEADSFSDFEIEVALKCVAASAGLTPQEALDATLGSRTDLLVRKSPGKNAGERTFTCGGNPHVTAVISGE